MFAYFNFDINFDKATAGRPYGLCVDFNIISAVNYNITSTISRREQILPNSGTLLSATQTFPLTGE